MCGSEGNPWLPLSFIDEDSYCMGASVTENCACCTPDN